ncbi:hypothetical protein [Priestia megaterium]
MIAEWDVLKRNATIVRTIITANVLARKNAINVTTMVTADALARKDATSMTTTTMATANALARKNAISVTTMIHVMRRNIIVKTVVTMITVLFFFNIKVKASRLFP